ncbi:MAG: hypothetical protein LC754_04405 [Acidobacteria bacterium]|nr:hypothetical protein [Acidobacteriota bacterium]
MLKLSRSIAPAKEGAQTERPSRVPNYTFLYIKTNLFVVQCARLNKLGLIFIIDGLLTKADLDRAID